MSEFDADIARMYVDLMAGPVVDGLTGQQEIDQAVRCRAVGAYLLQSPILQRLEQVDWENSGLPTMEWGSEDNAPDLRRHIDPGEYARRLMVFAFDDVNQILKLCDHFLARHGLPREWPIDEVLSRSKKALLTVAQLMDKEKIVLFRSLEYPEHARHMSESIVLPAGEQPLRLAHNRHDEPYLAWHPVVEDYIKANTSPGRGCPAHNKIIQDADSKKQSLIYYFWDKLVTHVYGQ